MAKAKAQQQRKPATVSGGSKPKGNPPIPSSIPGDSEAFDRDKVVGLVHELLPLDVLIKVPTHGGDHILIPANESWQAEMIAKRLIGELGPEQAAKTVSRASAMFAAAPTADVISNMSRATHALPKTTPDTQPDTQKKSAKKLRRLNDDALACIRKYRLAQKIDPTTSMESVVNEHCEGSDKSTAGIMRRLTDHPEEWKSAAAIRQKADNKPTRK